MSWIQTYTGKKFHPLEPRAEEIDIRDIAHSLAMQCRFNGHCSTFYSVADHSVRVSCVLPPELQLAGLLHDAAEAYVSDIPRPVKARLPSFSEAEDRLLEVIFRHFGLAWPVAEEVWEADVRLLVTEGRDLMCAPPEPWGIEATPLEGRIVPLSAGEAERAFLSRFRELAGHA